MDQQSAQVWFVKCRCSKKDFEREKIDKNHPICINLMVSNLRDFEFFEFRYILHRKITPGNDLQILGHHDIQRLRWISDRNRIPNKLAYYI